MPASCMQRSVQQGPCCYSCRAAGVGFVGRASGALSRGAGLPKPGDRCCRPSPVGARFRHRCRPICKSYGTRRARACSRAGRSRVKRLATKPGTPWGNAMLKPRARCAMLPVPQKRRHCTHSRPRARGLALHAGPFVGARQMAHEAMLGPFVSMCHPCKWQEGQGGTENTCTASASDPGREGLEPQPDGASTQGTPAWRSCAR